MDSLGCTGDTANNDESAVEIIRRGLRKAAENERKHHRNREFNKLRRTALGVQLNDNCKGQCDWSGKFLVQKGKDLKRKTLSVEDYKQLEVALLQGEDNINGFMSIEQILSALVRDLSSSNPEIQLLALHCCCNIALGGRKHSTALCKNIGPYLVTQLESRSNPLLEASAWTIGNLCNSDSKKVLEVLHNLGCLNRLCSLLKSCHTTIISSIAYALKFYLFGNSSRGVARESDFIQVTQIIVERLPNENHMSSDILWLLALLSSTFACRNHLSTLVIPILSYLGTIVKREEGEDSESDANEVIAIVRLLANLASEGSGVVADSILTSNIGSGGCGLLNVLNKLLSHPHVSVRKETLWLIGNLYNHPSLRVSETLKNYLESLDFSLAVESI
ncbi:importin subunit alpha-9 isoform X1 [Diachasma alloeum]|uniref:importin subunit alpha-9 isoform X1 n=1 Tax=Diachasma alloeum TaxID=454923 RepID=UPI00073847E4|nr:importin subunit alpha-9 isoform X1 [Diachasma alloeum]XP_015120980.1 importin subunit alpha-9 isoform X1 [Diachasma alloeum]